MKTGILFDIQRFSVHDGNGIRTNIFFKGCPLRCDWCSNPESQKEAPQPIFEAAKCIGCGACAKDCLRGAITNVDGVRAIDTAKCFSCEEHSCTEHCYTKAMKIAGKLYTVEEVMKEVKKDLTFYALSGGGVTFSGGEPLLQIDFLVELLKACKESGINTAIETCGAVAWEHFEKVLPYMDSYLFDIKHVDPEKMRVATGCDGKLILENFRRLAEKGADITVRVPVIPGFNSSEEEIIAIGRFAKQYSIQKINLLTYHEMGIPKYAKIFSTHSPVKRQKLTAEEMNSRIQRLRQMGCEAEIG